MIKTKKVKARILELVKDDMTICSSRVIFAQLEDITSKNIYKVNWAECPVVIGPKGIWYSKAQNAFKKAWQNCKVGDTVRLYHAEDSNSNYFEPI